MTLITVIEYASTDAIIINAEYVIKRVYDAALMFQSSAFTHSGIAQ